MMVWQSLITTLPNEPFVLSALGKILSSSAATTVVSEALLYGLIGTCRLNGIDPETYLRHILSVLPEWPSNKWLNLPWNVELTINNRQYGAHLTLKF
jgi:transposase